MQSVPSIILGPSWQSHFYQNYSYHFLTSSLIRIGINFLVQIVITVIKGIARFENLRIAFAIVVIIAIPIASIITEFIVIATFIEKSALINYNSSFIGNLDRLEAIIVFVFTKVLY
jgi:hypothetical protein